MTDNYFINMIKSNTCFKTSTGTRIGLIYRVNHCTKIEVFR